MSMNIDPSVIRVLYEDLVNDTSLSGVKRLLNKHGIIGCYKEGFYTRELYAVYGKDEISKITRPRLYSNLSRQILKKSELKTKGLEPLAIEIYNEFIANDKVYGLGSLFKSRNIGSKVGLRIRGIIYSKFGKQHINDVSHSRVGKMSNAARNLVYKHHSEDVKRRISESNKKHWVNNEAGRQKSRELMIKYCAPHSQSDEAIRKRVESRKWYTRHSDDTRDKISKALSGRPFSEHHKQQLRKPKSVKRMGYKCSEETKKKLSVIAKKQWLDGVHKRTFKSKGQMEVIKILMDMGYDVEDEFLFKGRPYDVYVREKNLLIEFNGTYWHRDPRFYTAAPDVSEVWEKGQKKS
jgi:hypothetical protein